MEPAVIERSGHRRALVLGAGVGAGLTAVAVLLVGLVGGRARLPADDSPDAGFARDMATHHAQAAEMAFMVRDASTDERLRTLAYDIIATQTAQRGILMGWLQQWGLPQASTRPRMAWMPMSAHAAHSSVAGGVPGAMAGMASDDEIAALRAARGRDAEILFLQLMIRHHEGGVLMARSVLAGAPRDEVATLATQIDRGQAAEIELMTGMLTERGARPLPSILAVHQ